MDFGIGKKITIYSGPIHRVCADNFVLNKNGRVGFTKVVKKDKTGYFYVGDATGGELTSIDEGYVLPNRDAAFKMCTEIVNKNSAVLMSALTGRVTDPKEVSRIYKTVKEESVVLYYDRNEVKQCGEQSKKDFKETLKQAENERAKRKIKK